MIPNKVKIGCYEYPVIRTTETIVVNGRECGGSVDYRNHVIKILDRDQDEQAKEVTFWHEVIHAIFDYRNINPSKNDEETITEELARGLYIFLQQNKNLPGLCTDIDRFVISEGKIINLGKLPPGTAIPIDMPCPPLG